MEGPEQAVALNGETLAIGRRAAPVPPHLAQRHRVMVVDQDGVGCLECRLAQEPAAGVLQALGGDGIDALCHGGKTEIGAGGNQGCEQGAVRITAARFIATQRLESASEAAPAIDLFQQVFDAHPRQTDLHGFPQGLYPWRDRQRIGPLEFQFAVQNGGKFVVRQVGGSGPSRLLVRGGECGDERLRRGRQVEPPIRLGPVLQPPPVIVDQIPEGDVFAAFAQDQGAGAQGVADCYRQGDLPEPPVDLAVLVQEGAPGGWNEGAGSFWIDARERSGLEGS